MDLTVNCLLNFRVMAVHFDYLEFLKVEDDRRYYLVFL